LSAGDEVFRESSWNRALGALIALGLAGLPLCAAVRGGGWFFWVFAAFMALLASMFVGMFIRTLGSQNWLVRLSVRHGVIVKFRSFANAHLPAEDLVAFSLSFKQIRWARKWSARTQTCGTHDRARRISSMTCLELGVDPALTESLAPHLDLERQRPAPQRGTLVKSRTRILHYPVSIPEAGVIRIQWRGPQTRITPSLDRVLSRIARHVALEEAREAHFDCTSAGRGDGDHDEVSFRSKLRHLVETGDSISATDFVRRTRGLSFAEARAMVDQVSVNASGASP
jgi:hypothetical protein